MTEEAEWRRAGRLFSRAEWRRTGEQWISVACTSKEAIIVCTNHAGQISARSKKASQIQCSLFLSNVSPKRSGNQATSNSSQPMFQPVDTILRSPRAH